MTTEDFVKLSNDKHNYKYDYSKSKYVNANIKVCIICPIHGEFWKRPINHYKRGQGCPKCSKKHKYTTEEWIEEARRICGDIYDWSKVNYVNNRTKVTLICPKHGEFTITPNCLLNGERCKECSKENAISKRSSNAKEFIAKAQKIHNGKYDYSKVFYINNRTKVCITCPTHGDFWQKPNSHLSGCGCSKCGSEKRGILKRSKLEDVIKNFKITHNNRYDYSKVEYKTTESKVCIICPKHGEFWQTPHSHLAGEGCPSCSRSLMEEYICIQLDKHKIEYETQKTFEWLKSKGKLRLDFYLPKYKIAIECQGRQHFDVVSAFGGEKGLFYTKYNDDVKRKLCNENGVKLYYINYNDNLEEKFNELLNIIGYERDTI